MQGYLVSHLREECFGCGACYQACPVQAISMEKDVEGFRYPVINNEACIHCNKCRKVCPAVDVNHSLNQIQKAWGGYYNSNSVREQSTSGGAFTAIAEEWMKDGDVIFGAELQGSSNVMHSCISDIKELDKFRRSKYLQSDTKNTFQEVKEYLSNGKKVLFSGTPCQIAGLKNYVGTHKNLDNLLLVEVVCEGVPTPKFTELYIKYLEKRFRKKVKGIDWRDKNKNKWDFEFMKITFDDESEYKISRWFNPFWSIWLQHLMSRPSCYSCPFATSERGADITIADLWGVHLYCPELYGKNKGCSLVTCNTKKGLEFWEKAQERMYGHELEIADALRYQSPMRKHIDANPNREMFMSDLDSMDYESLCKKWAKKPTLKLLFQKYVYGNRQKVALWNLKKRLLKRG